MGVSSSDLLSIISESAASQPPPLDFDDPPKFPTEIPLERHGSLLLLAARAAGATMFESGLSVPSLPVFPDLAQIFINFLGESDSLAEVTYGQPHALLDSLLALTIHATQQPIETPARETEFRDFVLTLTACTARQSHGIVRQISATVFHSHPSPATRFKLIRAVLEDDRLGLARDSAVSWLREEVAGTGSADTIFHDPLYFWALFPSLFHPVKTATSASLLESWTHLTQTQGPALHSALSLYYLLLSSPSLRGRLHLEKTVTFFRTQVVNPLRKLFRDFEADLSTHGGDGLIESAVGEEMCQIGNARSVGLIGLTLDQIEETLNEVFGTDDSDRKGYCEAEEARVMEIRRETEFWN